jgi:putative FmdB family regulatory protein
MPLYEYECDACGKRFERIQKFSDPPPEACPSCGGAVRKLLSSPAIQFKGTGWYITDYAKKTGGDGAKDSKATASKDSDSTTGAKDAKSTSASDSSASSPSSTSAPSKSQT